MEHCDVQVSSPRSRPKLSQFNPPKSRPSQASSSSRIPLPQSSSTVQSVVRISHSDEQVREPAPKPKSEQEAVPKSVPSQASSPSMMPLPQSSSFAQSTSSMVQVSVQTRSPELKPKELQVRPANWSPSHASPVSMSPSPQYGAGLHSLGSIEHSAVQARVPAGCPKLSQVIPAKSVPSQASPISTTPLPQTGSVAFVPPSSQATMAKRLKNAVRVLRMRMVRLQEGGATGRRERENVSSSQKRNQSEKFQERDSGTEKIQILLKYQLLASFIICSVDRLSDPHLNVHTVNLVSEQFPKGEKP